MAETIFTKILRGEIPCHRVYEDEHVLAFLDIGPLARGHTLVIPKEPAPTLDRLSDDAAGAIGRVLPRICRAVCRATGTRDYNVIQNNGEAAGQVVMHLHFHIIPKPAPDAGLALQWRPGELEGDPAKLAQAMANAIADDPGPLGISDGSAASS